MPFIPEDGSDIFDDRLKDLMIQCPDCDTWIYGSGRMVYNALTQRWYVEYWCPIDQQNLLNWNADAEPLLREIAADFGY